MAVYEATFHITNCLVTVGLVKCSVCSSAPLVLVILRPPAVVRETSSDGAVHPQVITFFSSRLEKTGPSPYSSAFVLETIVQASKSWPRNRLRVSVSVYVHFLPTTAILHTLVF